VIIKVERSGGITGIPVVKELDGKELPATLMTTAKKIMDDKNLSNLQMKMPPRGAADYYVYKISFQDGNNRRIIECNEYNIQKELNLIVKYIEKS
jgi:hypothetical protein